MNSIYCTGTTNGEILERFSFRRHSNLKRLDETDVVFVLGSLGLPYTIDTPLYKRNSESTDYVASFLNNKPWTTIALCGDMDNFALIKAMPQIEKFGAKLRQLTLNNITYDHIYLIDAPALLQFETETVLAIPGSYEYRPFGQPIQFPKDPNEIKKKVFNRIDNFQWLNTENDSIDQTSDILADISSATFILSQKLPISILYQINNLDSRGRMEYNIDIDEIYLENIYNHFSYEFWFSGYFPKDCILNDKLITLNKKILKIHPKE